MRQTETVTIKATDEVKRLAETALMIQDASNPRAVARVLIEIQDHFSEDNNGQDTRGSDFCHQNPPALLVLDKLASLANVRMDIPFDTVSKCGQLARGENVDTEIHFLR